MLLFGGGIKGGTVFGKTADTHPMLPVENPVELPDVHATIYRALGIPPDTNYITEGRPIHITNLGQGKPLEGLYS